MHAEAAQRARDVDRAGAGGGAAARDARGAARARRAVSHVEPGRPADGARPPAAPDDPRGALAAPALRLRHRGRQECAPLLSTSFMIMIMNVFFANACDASLL